MKYFWVGMLMIGGYILFTDLMVEPFLMKHWPEYAKKHSTDTISVPIPILYYDLDGKYTVKMPLDSVVVNYKNKTIVGWYQKNISYTFSLKGTTNIINETFKTIDTTKSN
jgi:hypothetical protein